MKSRAMVLERPGLFQEHWFPVPEPGPEDFILRVEYVTVCGGDIIEYEGGNRKAHYPLLMGHELVGSVESVGTSATATQGVTVGDRVTVEPYIRCGKCTACIRGDYHFCSEGMVYGVTVPASRPPHLWGAYGQYLYGAPGARVHHIDDHVPREAAALTAVIGNAVRWIRTLRGAEVRAPVLVTGLGVQALATILVAKIAGAEPVVTLCREADAARIGLAKRLGADMVVSEPSGEWDAHLAMLGSLRSRHAVECTGSETMFGVVGAALAEGGRIVAAGTRGGRPLSLDLDGIVFKELTIAGGLGQAGDTERATEIVNSCAYPIEQMVSHTLALAAADDAIALARSGRDDVIHVGLDPWAPDEVNPPPAAQEARA